MSDTRRKATKRAEWATSEAHDAGMVVTINWDSATLLRVAAVSNDPTPVVAESFVDFGDALSTVSTYLVGLEIFKCVRSVIDQRAVAAAKRGRS